MIRGNGEEEAVCGGSVDCEDEEVLRGALVN